MECNLVSLGKIHYFHFHWYVFYLKHKYGVNKKSILSSFLKTELQKFWTVECLKNYDYCLSLSVHSKQQKYYVDGQHKGLNEREILVLCTISSFPEYVTGVKGHSPENLILQWKMIESCQYKLILLHHLSTRMNFFRCLSQIFLVLCVAKWARS